MFTGRANPHPLWLSPSMTDPSHPLRVAMTVAGSDSGGGAGIQADIKTFHAFGVFGTSAITAITAQNTMGVNAVHPIPLDVVRAQIDAIVGDLGPSAVKTGMLATAELVHTVADALRDHDVPEFVLDPVMVSTSGARLLDPEAVHAVVERLVPLCSVIAPNLDEARILTGLPTRGVAGQREAAHALVEMGAAAALVKGGHGDGVEVVDLLWDGRRERVWRRARIRTRSTHGTGCTLSAAITAGLAKDEDLAEAVDRALAFVAAAIRTAPGLGHGYGPVNHWALEPTHEAETVAGDRTESR
jgi:hydroxymethylpyrimidine/phosphomethylpyrimidine kinase